jgi:acetyl esterase/lipase
MRLPAVLALVTVAASSLSAADPVVIELWPGKVPGEPDGPASTEVVTNPERPDERRVANVTKPSITVFRPAPEKNTGAAVVVAPGGGYNFLSWDHEGESVGKWLASIGVTGIALKYRVPKRPDHPSRPLMDAQRAISLTRSHAKEWGVDPARVGMLGFSAGGHLAVVAATAPDKRAYDPIDDSDKESFKPSFAALIYPGGIMSRETGELIPEVKVTKDTPPMFLAHCSDDRGSSEQSVKVYLALKKAGVPSELHVYASGGHGFGIRPGSSPSAQWPKRCEEWMKTQGLLGKPAK